MVRYSNATAPKRAPRTPDTPRARPVLLWLIGATVIPLLIAAIGYSAFDRAGPVAGPTAAEPRLTTSTAPVPTLTLAPLSIVRNNNTVTLSGDFPDDSAKAALTKALKASLPASVNVVDQIQLNPNVDALDFTRAGPVFAASASMTDFSLTVNSNTLTLAGNATSIDQNNAIYGAAKQIWSGLNVVDNIKVNGTTPAPVDPCANLQASVDAATGGPITFDTNEFSLTSQEDQALTQVADKLKACPSAHVTVNGYTDNYGTEATNNPLSTQRAGAVADFLVANGVARDHVAAKGLGSVNPVAPNDTADGRARNRRVEILVS